MRSTFTRSIAAALTAATILTSLPLTQASAATPAAIKFAAVSNDLSARRHFRGGNAAVAFGAFALIAAAAIAASRHDDYCGAYGCGYGYAPASSYYGPGYYHRGHRGRHWHR